MTKFLDIEDFKDVCFVLAKELLSFDEPIPDFETRYPGKLESILETPKQGLASGLVYPTLTLQASVLFYSLIKGHPLLNGNKRLAVVALLVFLDLNDSWLYSDWKTLYGLTIFVAGSESTERHKVLEMLDVFISSSLAKK